MLTELYLFFLIANDNVVATTRTIEQCRDLAMKLQKEAVEDGLEIPVFKCKTGLPNPKFNVPTNEVNNAVENGKV